MKGLEMTFMKLKVAKHNFKNVEFFLQIHMKGLEMTFVKLQVDIGCTWWHIIFEIRTWYLYKVK